MVKGYCVKCGEKADLISPLIHTTARGGFMAKGKCSKCKTTTVCSIMSKVNADAAIKSGEAKKA